MSRRAFVVALAALALGGCGKPWSVRNQAAPNPFVGASQFTVAPISYEGLEVGVKTEDQYLAEKDDEARSNWAGDKKAMTEEFFNALRSEVKDEGLTVQPGTEGGFVIRPHVSFIEPGFYAVMAAKPSEVRMTVSITKDGEVLDEIVMSHQTGASMTNPAVGNRLRDDAEALGGYMGEYLLMRTQGEGG